MPPKKNVALPSQAAPRSQPPSRFAGSSVARSDWPLLALVRSPDLALTPVQIQKAMFLLGKNCEPAVGANFYRFQPYNYGPFDSTVYSDAGMLAGLGMVAKNDSGSGYAEYAPTADGLLYAEKLKLGTPPKAISYLEKVVPWAQSLSFSALVRAIYAKYPEFKENSVFQG